VSSKKRANIGGWLFLGAVVVACIYGARPPDSISQRGGTRSAVPTVISRYTPTPTLEQYCGKGRESQVIDDYLGTTCKEVYFERKDWESYESEWMSRSERYDNLGWDEDKIYRGGPLD
jgi:hypothetical protein